MNQATGELERFLSSDFEASHLDEKSLTAGLAQLKKSSPSMYAILAPFMGSVISLEKEIESVKRGGGSGRGPKANSTIADYAEIHQLMNESVGDMYIVIKRTTNTVVDSSNNPVNLPYTLFGINDYDNNYNTLMGQQLNYLNSIVSTKVVLTLAKVNGGVNFIYTQGGHSDTITVNFIGGVTSYTNALNAQNQDNLNWGTRFILYTISDPTNGLAQIQNGFLNFNEVGVSSNQQANVISIDSRKLSNFFQDDRVEMIFPVQNMNAKKGIVDTIIPVPEEDSYFQIKQNIFQCYKGDDVPAQYKKDFLANR